jgi:hypothetical protein
MRSVGMVNLEAEKELGVFPKIVSEPVDFATDRHGLRLRQVAGFDDKTVPAKHTYCMTTWDKDTEQLMEKWTEQEVRAVVGASPATVEGGGVYEPSGRNAWFGYAIAEVVAPIALRRMAEVWEVRPPYPDWSGYAPAIRQHADEQMLTAKLPRGTTLAQWYCRNEPLLQADPSDQQRIQIVASALLPLFDAHPECFEAIGMIDDDFSRGTFAEYLAGWHARVSERCRPFVRRIARGFGVEISMDRREPYSS